MTTESGHAARPERATLGTHARGRDNNFNLIRMVAASAVLVSHAWPIALGPGTPEPLEGLLDYSLGTLAVLVFFVISGFLISASFERTHSVGRFLAARALRIFPGLTVSLLLVALVMGPPVSTLSAVDYMANRDTWTFLLRNITLISPQYTLPGVFQSNPYPTVEGSIWTLMHEVGCYLGVVLVGAAGILGRPALILVAMLAFLTLWIPIELDLWAVHPKLKAFMGLAPAFIIGMAFHVWKDRIPLNLGILAVLIIPAALLRETSVWPLALMTVLAYATFWVAYVPEGPVRAYNRLGDYSYGVYVYAFPLQGLVMWLWGPLGPVANVFLSLGPTLILAALSWHLIEEPALRLRHRMGSVAQIP